MKCGKLKWDGGSLRELNLGEPGGEITAAERSGDKFESNLGGLWRTEVHLLDH